MSRLALVLAVVGGMAVLPAQAPAEQSAPVFEVASVKPNISGDFRYTVHVQLSGPGGDRQCHVPNDRRACL